MIDVIIITITLFLQWISNNFKVQLRSPRPLRTIWPCFLLAILLPASESLAYFKNRHVRNMSRYYLYYFKKMSQSGNRFSF